MDDFSTDGYPTDGYPTDHLTTPADIIRFILCGTFGVILGLIAASFIISVPSLVIGLIMEYRDPVFNHMDFWINYGIGTLGSIILMIIVIACIYFPQI